jgi:hypothetical protein
VKPNWSKVRQDLKIALNDPKGRTTREAEVRRGLALQRKYIKAEMLEASVGDSTVELRFVVDPDEVQVSTENPDHAIELQHLTLNEVPLENVKIRVGAPGPYSSEGSAGVALALTGSIDPKAAATLREAGLLSLHGQVDEFRRIDAYTRR